MAADVIEEAVNDGEISEARQRAINNAWRVIEQVDGKPAQQIQTSGTQEVRLKVSYEQPPPPKE